MFFSDVAGQDSVKVKLTASAKTGRIPHAQLFTGPEGSGTLPMALAYAQYILCTEKKENNACGVCNHCRKVVKLSHPDLHFSFPVNTTKKIIKDPISDDFIADWRTFIEESPYFSASGWYKFIGLENKQGIITKREGENIAKKLSLKPYESEFRIMIIWLPEKMHPAAANMLLKLIEEPPDKTIFLLVSEFPDQLIHTIASRTQPVKLGTIPDEAVMAGIQKLNDLAPTNAAGIARLANGNFIKAQEMLRNREENQIYLDQFTGIMRMCWKRDYFGINTWVEEMSAMGREGLKSFFEYALRMVRENFVSNVHKPEIVYQTAEEESFSSNFHPFINGNNVIPLYEEMNKAVMDIERNGYARIILFDMALHIMKLIR